MAKTITKLFAIFVAIALCACLLAGCSGMLEVDKNHTNKSSFVRVEDGDSYWIVYHKETKVMYAVSHNTVFTVMVDAEGKPLLYSED